MSYEWKASLLRCKLENAEMWSKKKNKNTVPNCISVTAYFDLNFINLQKFIITQYRDNGEFFAIKENISIF